MCGREHGVRRHDHTGATAMVAVGGRDVYVRHGVPWETGGGGDTLAVIRADDVTRPAQPADGRWRRHQQRLLSARNDRLDGRRAQPWVRRIEHDCRLCHGAYVHPQLGGAQKNLRFVRRQQPPSRTHHLNAKSSASRRGRQIVLVPLVEAVLDELEDDSLGAPLLANLGGTVVHTQLRHRDQMFRHPCGESCPRTACKPGTGLHRHQQHCQSRTVDGPISCE